MTFQPNPRQSLVLWRMIAAERPEDREPMLSKVRPALTAPEKKALVDAGYLDRERRGRASYLILTDRAWAWAGGNADIELPKSQDAAAALQGLLRRLVPFLRHRDLTLAEVFEENAGCPPSSELEDRVLVAAASLVGASGAREVRIADLRERMATVPRSDLDAALLKLHDARRIVLSRDDNTAKLTETDRTAALAVGEAPRHFFYLKG